MKICPLITQTSILDDKELLVRELDDVEPMNDGTRAAPGSDDEIFINPPSKQHSEESLVDEIASVVPVRFLAKSYRGRVECLGELCRFHDDDLRTCRIERLIAGEAARGEDAMAAIRAELEKAQESQRKSGSELFDLMKEIREKNETSVTELRTGVERKLDDLASFMRAASEEKQKAIEAIALTLDAKTDEIERKIDSGEQVFQTFRDEVSGWKGSLAKNLETIETGLGEHRKLVRELSDNHTGIMNLVEDQKKSIEEEEKKRRTTEARMLNNGGVMAYHNGQYEKALDLFKKAIDIDPAMTESYNNLGLTYTEINEEEKATEAFKKAISLSPETRRLLQQSRLRVLPHRFVPGSDRDVQRSDRPEQRLELRVHEPRERLLQAREDRGRDRRLEKGARARSGERKGTAQSQALSRRSEVIGRSERSTR